MCDAGEQRQSARIAFETRRVNKPLGQQERHNGERDAAERVEEKQDRRTKRTACNYFFGENMGDMVARHADNRSDLQRKR